MTDSAECFISQYFAGFTLDIRNAELNDTIIATLSVFQGQERNQNRFETKARSGVVGRSEVRGKK